MKFNILFALGVGAIAAALPAVAPIEGDNAPESHHGNTHDIQVPEMQNGKVGPKELVERGVVDMAELSKRDGHHEKRGLTLFKPSGPYNSGSYYYYGRYFTDCDGDRGETWYFGRTIKTTIDVKLDSRGRYDGKSTNWWTNSSWYDTKGGANPGGCNLFSKDLIEGCQDGKIIKKEKISGKGTVVTYFDCLLQKQVKNWYHEELGADVVNWQLGGWDNYRFYDENNFAWFISCPLEDVFTSHTYDKRDRFSFSRTYSRGRSRFNSDSNRNSNSDDDGDNNDNDNNDGDNNDNDRNNRWGDNDSNDGPGRRITGGRALPTKNPIWDFGTPKSRNPFADPTPLDGYDATILSKNFRNTDLVAVGATYWVQNTIRVDGKDCQQMAVSRPGLLHWTATFYYDPSERTY